MANVRVLKKEIDRQIFQVISDCFTYSALHPDEKAEDLYKIVSDACNLRNDLIHRVNNPSTGDDSKDTRKHYQLVRKDLVTGVDKLFGKLSSLLKKKAK